MKSPFYGMLLLCAFCSFCKSNQYTADNLPAKQIRWGEGGGFTGRETAYVLLENGQVFLKKGMGDTFAAHPSAPKSQAKRLYKRAEELRLMDLDFQDPGNMYSFIEIIDGDQVRRIVWGGNKPAPNEVAEFYKDLQNTAK